MMLWQWRESLVPIRGSIVFIDECNSFVKSEDFAISIKESDNYFVIITRNDLPNLPYSVNEIYGIRQSNKGIELLLFSSLSNVRIRIKI